MYRKIYSHANSIRRVMMVINHSQDGSPSALEKEEPESRRLVQLASILCSDD